MAAGASLSSRPLTPEEARTVASWRYPPPFDVYDLRDEDAETLLARDHQGHGYYPVEQDGRLVGFVCFGAEGRVPGQQAEAGTCDIGMGIDPQLVSTGVGGHVLPQAVAFAVDRLGAARLRLAVAAFNERSLRLSASAGFVEHRRFSGPGGRPFVELVLPAT